MSLIINQTGYRKAVELLEKSTSEQGILASTQPQRNYYRIWARDGIISGLAGLVADNTKVIQGLMNTLLNLGKYQGADGQIASNIQFDSSGKVAEISYGTLSGKVDTIPLFIIGVCQFYLFQKADSFFRKLGPQIDKALTLMNAWEYNQRGLLYVPEAGDWMDEIPRQGYILYDQLLRIWAMRCWARVIDNPRIIQETEERVHLLRTNYWPSRSNLRQGDVYHSIAFQQFLEQREEKPYWAESFGPSGYSTRFDALANALAILLDIGTTEQNEQVIQFKQALVEENPLGMVPNIWPPILPDDREWKLLCSLRREDFRNRPFRYQNGGSWPMVNGWWGMALAKCGKKAEAENILKAIHRFNKKDTNATHRWGFYECGDSQTGDVDGVKNCTWSAAGAILLQKYLEGKSLWDI